MISKIPSIVIVGAGFAGLSTYLVLRKRLGKHASLLLIDQRKEFTYIPALHNCIGNPGYLKSIQFDYKKYYGKDFLYDTVTEITKTTVSCASGTTFSPDYIVIATGSRSNTFGNENRERYGNSFRFAKDIELLNKEFPHANTITVVGGGYTGIEIISSLAEKYPEKQLRIIHSKERLLDRYSSFVSETVYKRLKQRNVEIILHKKLSDMQEKTLVLHTKEELQSDITIISSGIAINDDSYRDNLKFHNSYKALEGDHVYLCGDVAEHGLLSTAHNAMIEGRRIGHHIADKILGEHKEHKELENRVILALALGTRDGMITNGPTGFFVPRVLGLCKRVVEKRCMFEFKRKIMLWV